MIKINLDKDKIHKSLNELERDFNEGKVSKKEYTKLKNEYNLQLENFEAAERIKRLQGRGSVEKPLDHWTNKKKEADAEKEKDELVKKYVTPAGYKTTKKSPSSLKSSLPLMVIAFLAVAFIVGIGLGSSFLSSPSDSTKISVAVNESAFPDFNNTNMTNQTKTTKKTTNQAKNDTKKPEPEPEPEPEPKPEPKPEPETTTET